MLGSSAGGPEIWLSISAQPRTMSGFFQEFPVPALLSHFSLSLAPEMQCNCTHRSCQRLLELKLQIVLGFSLPQSLSSFESADTSFLWTSLIPQFFPPLFLWSLLRLLGRFPPPPHCLSLKCYSFPVFVLCFTLSLSTHPLGLPHYPS